LFESENKEGYIHGFTENYVKVKAPGILGEHFTRNQSDKIDDDGSVRIEFVTALV
jgi:threonylcarbamoyladenosine tRNA methylthiotransferase MtaB